MRLHKDEVGILKAVVDANRGTCARRKVGCVLTNDRGHVMSTGYNGRPSGWAHCTDEPCPGVGKPSGEGLEHCEAIHAEANALLQCPDKDEIHTCYTTTAPCGECVKLLLNTGCRRIVFLLGYPHDEVAMERWQRLEPLEWLCYDLSEIYTRELYTNNVSGAIASFVAAMLKPDGG